MVTATASEAIAQPSASVGPDVTPSATTTGSASTAPTDASKPVSINYTPPNPHSVAATVPPGYDVALYSLQNGALVTVSRNQRVKTVLVIQGTEVKEVRELAKGLSNLPDAIVGRYPDSLWVAQKKTIHAWNKDKWTEVAKDGPYVITPYNPGSSGVIAFKRDDPAYKLEALSVPGGPALDKLDAPPVRDKKCPLKPGAAVTLEKGEIVLLGGGCQMDLLLETWLPKQKAWGPTKISDTAFSSDSYHPTLQASNELRVTVTRLAGDTEPMNMVTTLTLQGAKWKAGKFVYWREAPAVRTNPFTPKKGDTYQLVPFEEQSAAGKLYTLGGLHEGETARAIIVLADYKIAAPLAVAPPP